MKSFVLRLTIRFALLVTMTTAVVLFVGGWILSRQMLHGVDMMHELEERELAEMIEGASHMTPAELTAKIRRDADYDEDLYYIQIHDQNGKILFRSPNLRDAFLPDLTGRELNWTTEIPQIGELRVSEFYDRNWHIQVASRLEPNWRLMKDYIRASLIMVCVAAVLGTGLGYGFSRYTLRPVRVIASTAHRIRGDNLSERIPVPDSGDELASLAALLNQMFDRLEKSFEQVRRFTADASHELKTPLALIRLGAERLRQRFEHDPETATQLVDLLEEVSRMNQVIESLLFLARADGGSMCLNVAPQPLHELMSDFAEDASVLAEDQGCRFELARSEEVCLKCDRGLIRQLLLNLVSNALKVSQSGELITLASFQDGDAWKLVVTDEGPGVPEDKLRGIFERFVQLENKQPNQQVPRGHGLGLAICQSIAELHGGFIRARNRSDRSGLVVEVTIPVS